MRTSLHLHELRYPANMLSLARLALVGPSVYYVVRDHRPKTSLALLVLGMATDAIDGPLARRRGEESELGKVLDPIADKLSLDALAIALSMRHGFPWWITRLLLVRDAGIVIGSLLIFRRTTWVPPSVYAGKVSTALLTVALLLYLINAQPYGQRVLAATLVPFAISWLEYAWRFWQWASAPQPGNG